MEEILCKGGRMNSNRLYFIISIPEELRYKFVNFLYNINAVNRDKEPAITIESIYTNKYVAIPKITKEGDDGE